MLSSIEFFLILQFFSLGTPQLGGLQRQQSFISCKYDTDCFENSFCVGNDGKNLGRCKCKDNYILVDRNRTHYECLLTAEGVNSPCSRDIQCQVNLGTLAICNERNVCQCAPDAHLSDKMCYKAVVLGELCISDYNCLLDDGTYGFCVTGKCACNINQHPGEDRKSCIPSVPLGKVCQKSESCIHTFANCFDGVCRCIVGYVESDDNSVCLEAASMVGDKCIESIQCAEYLKDSYCKNRTCICKSAHHDYGNECIPDAKLGERCNSDKECILSADLQYSVRCYEGVCACIEGVSDHDSYGCIILKGGQASFQPLNVLVLLLGIGFLIYLDVFL